jgi:arylsulfatase A-like enzyme
MARRLAKSAVKRSIGVASIAIVGLIVALAGCHEESRPNVILVIVDTLRADHLPFYGYSRNTMPHLSSWVDEAVVFDNCSSPIPITTPAISSILTGLYPRNHGARNTGDVLDDGLSTTAEVLREAGYTTAAFASINGLLTRLNVGQGFDLRDDRTLRPEEEGEFEWHTPEGAEMWQRRANEVTDAALAWLESGATEPYFLLVHYFDPHAYYDPPPPFRDRFVAQGLPTPPGLRSWWGDVTNLGETIALYDGEILTVDFHLDRLVRRLRQTGDWDRSLLVFTADHGESLGEHGHMDHGEWLYEEQVRVPLVVRYPQKVRGGRRIDDPVALIDLHSTILDLVGVSGGAGVFDGRSLVPLLEGRRASELPIFMESEPCNQGHILSLGMECWPPGIHGKLRAVRADDWKLILTPLQGDERLQLFHLPVDPGELENRSLDQSNLAGRLRKQLVEFWGDGGRSGPQDRELLEKLRALGYIETVED